MTEEGCQQSVQEELALAREELRAARQLIDGALPRVAMTRIYYALFHAVRALLYGENLQPKSHRGTLNLFNLHFVKAGVFPAGTSRMLSRLQRFREDADYAQGFVITGDEAVEELDEAETFVERVIRHLRTD